MKNIELSFITAKGLDENLRPIDAIDHNVTLINVPEHVILECAKKYATIIMQAHFRHGKGEYGKINLCGEIVYYK